MTRYTKRLAWAIGNGRMPSRSASCVEILRGASPWNQHLLEERSRRASFVWLRVLSAPVSATSKKTMPKDNIVARTATGGDSLLCRRSTRIASGRRIAWSPCRQRALGERKPMRHPTVICLEAAGWLTPKRRWANPADGPIGGVAPAESPRMERMCGLSCPTCGRPCRGFAGHDLPHECNQHHTW
jgi:hypothetical protein